MSARAVISAALVALAIATTTAAHADVIDPAAMGDAIAAQLLPALPADLGVASVVVPASLSQVRPDAIRVEPPRELHAGRPSVRVSAHGKTFWVPVVLSPLVEVAVTRHAIASGSAIAAADVTIERRAIGDAAPAPASQLVGATAKVDLAAAATVLAHDIALAPPLARGTQVAVEVRHGSIRVRGTGVLELAARPGEAATVRLAFNRTVARGMLHAPALVVIGDQP